MNINKKAKDEHYRKAVQAITYNNPEDLIVLLQSGLDVHYKPDYEFPLILVAGSNKDMVELLLHYGADINEYEPSRMNTPLLLAAAMNDTDLVHYLLSKGANIHCMNFAGESPLFDAISHNNIKMFKMLLEQENKSKFLLSLLNKITALDNPPAQDIQQLIQERLEQLEKGGV